MQENNQNQKQPTTNAVTAMPLPWQYRPTHWAGGPELFIESVAQSGDRIANVILHGKDGKFPTEQDWVHAKVLAEGASAIAERDLLRRQCEMLRAAIQRLGSVEAFDLPGPVSEEVRRRIEFARTALASHPQVC